MVMRNDECRVMGVLSEAPHKELHRRDISALISGNDTEHSEER